MIFGRMPSLFVSRSQRAWSRRGVLAAVAVAVLGFVLGGCGGGGGDDNNNNGGGGRATVTGRLVNGITGEGVPGATIEYVTANGTTTTTTTADGSDPSIGRGVFVLSVPAPTTGVIRITAPGYYPFGVYNNLTFRLAQDGVAVQETVVGQQVDLGNIRLYSTDGPPPPPTL